MSSDSFYNPAIPRRRSIRLSDYDYSLAGLYFVTICVKDRQCLFGHIEQGQMVLNEAGVIAHRIWFSLPDRFQTISLDAFIVMPNHIHGIVVLNEVVTENPVGAGLAPAQSDWVLPVSKPEHTVGNDRAGLAPAPTLSAVIGAYKSLVSKECLTIFKSRNENMGKLWQRNYYEHIIRNAHSHQQIAEYISTNPLRWGQDTLYAL
ncbi:hypothetical protein QNI16_18295 [Cytophagaceae bacterium YF14B1]|uniref:Transposase IS200-like domain-containing protein n=1 Tax=Xanthocytophaga flava TaxID=3048013 RepID=A0AAE3QNR3_9BACT|nr:transposase [Xanthocytophaga flavus]MDJ1482460.1 hypothetical protein [Xanthocytophaga flavus]